MGGNVPEGWVHVWEISYTVALSNIPVEDDTPFTLVAPVPTVEVPLVDTDEVTMYAISSVSFSLPSTGGHTTDALTPDRVPVGELIGALVDTIISPATTDTYFPMGYPAAVVSATLGVDYGVPSDVDKDTGRVDLSVVRPLRVSVSCLFIFGFSLPLSNSIVPLDRGVHHC